MKLRVDPVIASWRCIDVVLAVRRVIWDGKNENPIPYVSKELDMDPYRCSDALHQIKQAGGLGPRDATVIYDNGDVVDASNGEEIGNLHDEF